MILHGEISGPRNSLETLVNEDVKLREGLTYNYRDMRVKMSSSERA
jgi:hypothetical protein